MRLRKQTNSDDNLVNVEPSQPEQQRTKNVVVFGESGVGKSSLINLIAGRKVSETSSGALGCTLEYKRHLVDIDDQQLAIWDTAGLDEGAQGSVPAEKAETYLKHLLHEFAKNNGVDLLIYCVRGTRVRYALLTNYHIFYSAICRRKVPIAIVITGLENQEGDMETWWDKNEPQFTQLNMFFDGHACVTTLESSIENFTTLDTRREISKTAVIQMITSTCRSQQWKPPERSWLESAYSDIRAMLSPRDTLNSRAATVIMCEVYRDCSDKQSTRKRAISLHKPITFSFSLSPVSFHIPISISDATSQPLEDGMKYISERLYRVFQVSSEVTEEETKKVPVVKRGADLLIFCVKMKGSEPATIQSRWKSFNLTYNGDLSPQIVIVIGASDQASANGWWNGIVGETSTTKGVDVTYWPDLEAEEAAERQRLQRLIEQYCIDYSKVTHIKDETFFKRSLCLDMSSLTSLLAKPDHNGLPVYEDVLTKWGVWQEVMEQSPSTGLLVSSPVKDS